MISDRRVRAHWRATVVAAASITLANVLVLVWVTQQGWLGGTAFPKPLGMRLVVYGTMNWLFVMMPLAAYDRVCRWSKCWALIIYLALVTTFSLVSIPVLHVFLARGIFTFGGGYTVAWDVTWGAAQYLLALALYRCIVSIGSV
jgi:hypothetical protein